MAGEIIQYQTEDGAAVIRLQASDGSVWLSQADMAELFQVTPQAITRRIRAIYEEGELDSQATCNDYLQVRTEGKREVSRQIAHYSLQMILAVGFRGRSLMAKNRKPMHMADWIARLDDFLKLGDHPLLDGAGKVTADRARCHVEAEDDRWHSRAINAPSAVEQHFIEATATVKKLAADKPAKGKGGVQ